MIYNYTRCESVIAKIMADLDSNEVRLRTSDIREWIFEAVDKIGAPMQYIKKESGADGVPVFPIVDNQVPIPEDLYMLDAVAYSTSPNGPWKPMKLMTGIFTAPKRHWPLKDVQVINTPPHDPNNDAIIDETVIVHEHQPAAYKMNTSQSQLYDFLNLRRMADKRAEDYYVEPEYFLKPGWIVTNKKKGFVKIAYKAVATDERGYPLIPDMTSYQEAVYWYVVMKLTFPKFMSGLIGGNSKYAPKYAQQLYLYTQSLWNFYRNQAYAEAMMPTPDEMTNIKNDWTKLIPDWDANETFFRNINKAQYTNNDHYYGY